MNTHILFWSYILSNYWGHAKFNISTVLNFSIGLTYFCMSCHNFRLKQNLEFIAKGTSNIWFRCDFTCVGVFHINCDCVRDRKWLGLEMLHLHYPLCLWMFLWLVDSKNCSFLFLALGSLQMLPVSAPGRLLVRPVVYCPIYQVLFIFKINFKYTVNSLHKQIFPPLLYLTRL